MKLSIVTTMYQSASYVQEFYERASAAASQVVGDSFEIVFVNDGSPDDSLQIAVDLTEQDPRVLVVDLSRNFGHHKAMMAGLGHARGERVFLIDCDLEEEPEWLASFTQALETQAADVIYGRQEKRKGGWFERWSGAAYYTMFNWLIDIDHPRNICTARLMSRRYVRALLRHQEREPVISCLWVITGFKQCEHVVRKHEHSPTTYGLFQKIGLAVNAVTSFSEFPLRLIFYVGTCIFTVSSCYAAYLIVRRLVVDQNVDGWTSLMVSLWLLGGMLISFVGVVGIYLAKVFKEIKARPNSIVRHVYGRDVDWDAHLAQSYGQRFPALAHTTDAYDHAHHQRLLGAPAQGPGHSS